MEPYLLVKPHLGNTATYSCNSGFDLVGSSTVTCLASGQWSDGAPTCQRKNKNVNFLAINNFVWVYNYACIQLSTVVNQMTPMLMAV